MNTNKDTNKIHHSKITAKTKHCYYCMDVLELNKSKYENYCSVECAHRDHGIEEDNRSDYTDDDIESYVFDNMNNPTGD